MSAPWIKFYPRDWRGDQALRACSVASRGLWMEMLCIMHEASPYGHLVLGGSAVSGDVLARMSGLGAEECGALLAELESAGVFSRTRKGVIYSRRMIKDKSRSEKGRKSVALRWSQASENKAKTGVPNRSPNRKPTTQKPEARGSVDKSTAAKPPDPWKEVYDLAIAVFEEGGRSKEQARSMVSLWRKTWSASQLVAQLIGAKGKADPLEYMQKALSSENKSQDEYLDIVIQKYGGSQAIAQ